MSWQTRTCDVCGVTDAEPYFTKRIKDIRKEDIKAGKKQPVWRCKRHKPTKVVSPIG